MTLWYRVIPTLLIYGSLFACGPSPSTPSTSDIEDKQSVPQNTTRVFKNPELSPPPDARYAASHILIAYVGAASAPTTVRLERQDAYMKADALHQELENGAPFEAYAQNHSNDPSGSRGGRLGIFSIGTMVPLFEQAVASVGIGEIAPLIETPFGFHIVRRDPINEARASHVLVSYASAPLSMHSRDKATAKTRIWEAYSKVQNGTPFKLVSTTYTDDSSSASDGDLGLIGEGQMVPEFDRALFSLSIGQVSEPFETAYGYHIVLRRK